MPRKKFIDKKNSTTFYLAHRSQKDPLIADENAPQHVLVPLEDATRSAASTSKQPEKKKDSRIDEQRKYGIYYDDNYDYLQHLKDSKDVSTVEWDICERIYASDVKPKDEEQKKPDVKDFKLNLPSSVFDSEYQDKVGLLNKAARSFGPRPDLDPDVIAALDDDFDFDDPDAELEDNFMEMANAVGDDNSENLKPEDMKGLFSDDDDEYEDVDDDEDNEGADTIESLGERHYHDFDEEETKTRFTNYSMSSSVVRRNKQLMLVDDRFEKIYEQYDDMDIGPLDCDDIEGDINPENQLLLKYAEEFEENRMKEDGLTEKIANIALKENESDSDLIVSSDEEEAPKEKWDCESILSTYSTTKNRPKLIKEPSRRQQNVIKISGKTGMPVGILGKGLTKGNLKELDIQYAEEKGLEFSSKPKTHCSGISTVRSRNETPEERHERKSIVKEYRKERRMERKANQDAFRDEKKRQEKVRLNIKSNVQGLKL